MHITLIRYLASFPWTSRRDLNTHWSSCLHEAPLQAFFVQVGYRLIVLVRRRAPAEWPVHFQAAWGQQWITPLKILRSADVVIYHSSLLHHSKHESRLQEALQSKIETRCSGDNCVSRHLGKKKVLPGSRTQNPRFRRPMPYPLGQQDATRMQNIII